MKHAKMIKSMVGMLSVYYTLCWVIQEKNRENNNDNNNFIFDLLQFQCSVGAQVNIEEDANGSADESLCGGRNELYEPMDNDRVRDDTSPAAISFIGETEKELTDAPPMTSSCQTCLIQQPNIQALMGVHWTANK